MHAYHDKKTIEFSWPYSLNDLEEFIKVAKSGLSVEVGEDDYDGLVGVMGHLLAVKDRQASTDNMFEPLKETIELLHSYDQVMSDAVHQQLEVCHEKLHTLCYNHNYCTMLLLREQIVRLHAAFFLPLIRSLLLNVDTLEISLIPRPHSKLWGRGY